MKKVMVFGTFDILHQGHFHMLEEARELGDYLVVVVARDITVSEVKGHYPDNNEEKRLKQLKACNIADKVRLGSPGNKHAVIEEEKPDVIALGYDQNAFTADLEKYGIQVVRLQPYKPEIYKSSLLKKQLR